MRAADSAVTDRLIPEMFTGPRRLRPVLPILRRLPAGTTARVLAAAAVVHGVVRVARLRRALAWSRAHGRSGLPRWRLALAVLANHGRFVAQEAVLGVSSIADLRRGVVLEGREHLDAVRTGAILLGFHLGPPRTSLVLRALGYRVHFVGQLDAARNNPRWVAALDAGDAIRVPEGAPRARLEGLHRIRSLLRDGALVHLTGDGPFGREAFRIDVPGGSVVLRMGWLALRRQTRVPTFPVLTYEDTGRRVIVVHPSLPDPDDDPARDVATCRAVLVPLIDAYVRRRPSQCRYVALPRGWPTD